jgi:ACS family pantothenate transporter-like MFS transporter
MWAMIGCSIALVIWTSGIIYMTVRAERNREDHELGPGELDVKQHAVEA